MWICWFDPSARTNQIKNHMSKFREHWIKGTKFYVYFGGAEIEGELKWVITTKFEDYDLLDAFMSDGHDQLWKSREEAEEEVGMWLMKLATEQIDQRKEEDE